MKIVVNTCYGGIELSEYAHTILDLNHDDFRTDPNLISLVERSPEKASGGYSKLAVVEIPDDATDYMINEYDGAEDVIYVLNGKLKYAFPKQ
jgi:hypothetical protein